MTWFRPLAVWWVADLVAKIPECEDEEDAKEMEASVVDLTQKEVYGT